MDVGSIALLAAVGLTGGFIAGLMGLGGGVVIIPLLIYVAGVPVRLATGISMVQSFFATLSAIVVHRSSRTVDVRLGVTLGIGGAIGALAGSVGAAYIASRILLAVYFGLVCVAVLLLFFAPRQEKTDRPRVSLVPVFLVGLVVGILAGMLGVGGGFILTPLMISVFHVPTRVAVGTALLMIVPATLTGSVGKIVTGQFDLEMGLPVIVGSILGAQIGGRVNRRISPRAIRTALLLLLAVILVRIGLDLFGVM
jgi:uncharacterized protein